MAAAKGKKGKPAKVEARQDAPAAAPKTRSKAPKTAKEILKGAKPATVEKKVDALEASLRRAAEILRELRHEKFEFKPAEAQAGAFDPAAFEEFFMAEIAKELEREATIFNDRFARWRCQCCDAVIPVPRRTTVLHGDYLLGHDDVLGLLVNGERWVPKAETPLEVVQPGRLRNPWTGELIQGKKLGTTG